MELRKFVLPLFLLVLTLTVAASTLVFAQAPSQQGGQARPQMMCQDRFKAMDADNDGLVTKDEFNAGPHQGIGKAIDDAFAVTDADADGKLTVEEFCAARGARRGMGMGKGNPQQ